MSAREDFGFEVCTEDGRELFAKMEIESTFNCRVKT